MRKINKTGTRASTRAGTGMRSELIYIKRQRRVQEQEHNKKNAHKNQNINKNRNYNKRGEINDNELKKGKETR